MSSTSLLVLAIDGLRASALGPYGNTTYPTPTFDRLASDGVVYDRCLTESSNFAEMLDAFWSGRHPCIRNQAASTVFLPAAVKAQGGNCSIVTDEVALTRHASADEWDEIIVLNQQVSGPANDPFETSFGHVLASALETAEDLSARKEPGLLWIQLRGMEAPWDAPAELAISLRDDEQDPLWEPSIQIPRASTGAEYDDDTLFATACRYAGQVMALDHCLGAFLSELIPHRRWNILVMGVRGFALGEHGTVGQPVPYKEQFHVPLCYRSVAGDQRLTRVADLVQPSDLFPWLSQLTGTQDLYRPQRRVAISRAAERLAVTTANWSAIGRSKGGDTVELELYREPDDRWQANNVASRCEVEVSQFAELCQRVEDGGTWQDLLPHEPPASSVMA